MKKKDKTPEGNQKETPQNQSKVRKTGISFDPEAWNLLENYAWQSSKEISQKHA